MRLSVSPDSRVLMEGTKGEATMYLRPHGNACQVTWRAPNNPYLDDGQGYYVLTPAGGAYAGLGGARVPGPVRHPHRVGAGRSRVRRWRDQAAGQVGSPEVHEGAAEQGSLTVTVTFRVAELTWV